MLGQIREQRSICKTLMTFAYHHPNYYKKLKKEAGEEKNKQATSEHQQADKRASTVDHDSRATDEQANPSDKQALIMDPGKSFKHP